MMARRVKFIGPVVREFAYSWPCDAQEWGRSCQNKVPRWECRLPGPILCWKHMNRIINNGLVEELIRRDQAVFAQGWP